jgi:hypothetical protein
VDDFIYLQTQKLKSTYVDGIMAHVKQGMLMTHWDQTAAATGRLTSTSPNIQAIPRLPVLLASLSGHNGYMLKFSFQTVYHFYSLASVLTSTVPDIILNAKLSAPRCCACLLLCA